MVNNVGKAEQHRILVIDDEVQIRRFLRIGMSSQGYDVLEAETAEKGLELAATQCPNLIILDLGLPGVDGKELLKEIRGWSGVPIMILSVRADENEKVAALDAGANDYVTKPFGLNEFLARTRNLLRSYGMETEHGGCFDDGYLAINLGRRRVAIDGQEIRLTRKEFDVLKMLFANRERVVTQSHMLHEIWGPAHADDTHYLRIIVGRLREKLGDDPTEPTYIHTEPGVGYRLTLGGDF